MNMLSEGKIKADVWSFEFTRDTSERDFLSSELKSDIYKLVHNGDYRSYYTPPYEICGKKFVFRVYFESGFLVSITLSPNNREPSWDNVENGELFKDKAENDTWLKNCFSLTAPASFTWGTIESTLDKRAGTATIVLRYKRMF